MNRISNITIQSTLFVPDNDGLYNNQVTHTSTYCIVLLISVAICCKLKVKCKINFVQKIVM